MTKPSKAEQYAEGVAALRDAVNAYRAAKQQPGAEPPQAPKLATLRLPPAERPTPIDGFPMNDSPPAQVPDYGTMGRVQAIRHRQRRPGAQLPNKPMGPTQLIKKRTAE
jgi:hypothetical protein